MEGLGNGKKMFCLHEHDGHRRLPLSLIHIWENEVFMNGILCIDKPVEYTSFDVVARIRGMSKTKKVGHGGTLDPMATGVLPVFLGTATKAVSLLPNNNKRYLATFQLGIKTDTLDSYGKILSKTKSYIKTEQLEQILPDFRGEISQLPPMYSAVRVNGRRLYDFAREGKEIERTPRMVTVYQLELTDFDEASQRGGLDISCSKGTYCLLYTSRCV